ncbi:NADH-quinone oxidoreductase subunit NuoF [Aminobacterium colombiense]|jgi:NADH:ubiquinone oxidoreductase subunit F (NADH-binding)/(2Fe-2S) ferredoxin/NAD-dependent dihydropyrimidine dehydrogenase PreA subunit|uniref:NADH dehydrogenase (Quinone) n=1 Tax=Aminobacterium colombiense (strain DSM 12261 / ALA-1) TaxID=572547 RepID=D5EGJ1_AMICL|nr:MULTISPECIES: NADH-quinone oxidoreductase subunit NuoF [Aminobacterium]ADE57673.1 NADH dehydrogenase (quinone) [Aminobacterium colombiense DSM 12261]MDD2378539.1 NADH-quinone oxidoreductase subunit NuoF [Aminobacterium colombiense]MDD4265267.1 NADH-quinone oxidoreductase subunit NuoF [Aminobacterium colombiense]MDD4585317.1 NADH-quinone oxidoreductase subunit NuoF [Aminobacterium colombiense]
MPIYRSHVLICGGTGCTSSGSHEVMDAFREELRNQKLDREVLIVPTGCHGMCEMGPIVVVYPEGTFYCRVKAEDVKEIVSEHLLKGRIVPRLLYTVSEEAPKVPHYKEIPFYGKQHRIALENCGYINPDNIEEYIVRHGYEALGKALTEMTREQVIEEVKTSGLRGRGGGGFPTGLKWSFCARAQGDKKYVICNADEGDPGAFMDRSILEGDPHCVIEGMMIGAYAIGADEGYIYCRAEYPLAIQRLKTAIEKAEAYGLLGKNIMGTDFSFIVHIKEGAGAFVCGEETALMASIEGQRGMPRPRPPFPANKGLWDKPSNINNVETWANIPYIILHGGDHYASMGTEKSKGTKVFALTGKVKHTGLVEVPMGITLREIIFDIGGGILNDKKFKAVQIGGPSGGCLTEEHLDLPVSYESLAEVGAIMGSGGMVVMDEENCMVDVAKFFLEFTQRESCGKCTPCREGTKQMLLLLNKISEGKGTMEDLDTLHDLAVMVKEMSLCGLGQTAPNPILTTLRYFRDEYVAHVKDKKCPAGVCSALIEYSIDQDLCKRCGLCARNCPVHCIPGDRASGYTIDTERCIRCGTCFEKCPFGAIIKG